jgi:short-subunit dehydrogenase
VNISSATGLLPLPMLAAYSGIKTAIVAMTRVWRAEGAMRGVGFTAICPGFMSTNIAKSVRSCSGTRRRTPGEFAQKVDDVFTRGKWDPARVADAVVRSVEKNKSVVPTGFETYLVDYANRISRRLTDFILKLSVRYMERWY